MKEDTYNILIIEDDKEISAMLSEFLSENGFVAAVAVNGVEGLRRAASERYNLIILDLMLPFKSGDELLRELRSFSDIPVIVISAKALTRDKIDLLNLGADDYVTKPFDLGELLARIHSNIKRYRGKAGDEVGLRVYGKICLNTETKQLVADGVPVDLTIKEYALLELMLSHPQKVFSKQNLYESVWGEPYAYDNDTINTHISNIRKKLRHAMGDDYIETVWGMGYKMKTLEIL